MTQTTETKVFIALETGRWYVSATGAPTAEVAQRHALCRCGAKIRLEDGTGPSSPTQSLSGLEYALHYAGEHRQVTSFDIFCLCPEPDLDANERCKICGTQWDQE